MCAGVKKRALPKAAHETKTKQSSLDKIVFATRNPHKLAELRQILAGRAQVLGLDDIGCSQDIPENGDTLSQNAMAKARYVFEKHGLRCCADDTGLMVDALDGQPGVHSARYAADNGCGGTHDAAANTALLLKRLQGTAGAARTARFCTVMAIVGPGGECATVQGSVEGHITRAPRGDGGFGYDPVFMPLGWDRTFAQATAEEKNSVSHRARATQKLVEYLAAHPAAAKK